MIILSKIYDNKIIEKGKQVKTQEQEEQKGKNKNEKQQK